MNLDVLYLKQEFELKPKTQNQQESIMKLSKLANQMFESTESFGFSKSDVIAIAEHKARVIRQTVIDVSDIMEAFEVCRGNARARERNNEFDRRTGKLLKAGFEHVSVECGYGQTVGIFRSAQIGGSVIPASVVMYADDVMYADYCRIHGIEFGSKVGA